MSASDDSLSAAWRLGYERLAKKIAGNLPSSKDSLILELGCGRGQLTIPLAKKFKGKIVAVDRLERDVSTLKESLEKLELENRVEAVAAGAEDLRNGKRDFDAVVSNFFIGWVDSWEAKELVGIIFEKLRDGGLVLHSDFLPFPGNPAQAVAIEQGKAENNEEPSTRWWTSEELSGVYEDAGFIDIDVTYFDWNMKFGFETAVEQLKRWKAKPGFISGRENDLRRHGMELPKSFILSARKPW